MFGRSKLVWVVVLATIMSLAGGATAMAQGMPGSASSAAIGNETGWVTLQPGQQHWYTFFSTTADSTATDAQLMVIMAASPEGSASFNVWTPGELQSAAAGNTDITAEPVGSGTLHPFKDGDNTLDRFGGMLEWTGQSLSPQTYLVQVTSKASTPVQYNLMVDGKYVRFTSGTLASQAPKTNVQLASAMPATPAKPAVQAASATNLPAPVTLPSTGQSVSPAALGSSTSLPFALNGAMHQINPGQSQWYVLQYPGELKGGAIPEGTLELIASPEGNANFSVWTADGLRALAAGDTDLGIPIGMGSMHPFTDGGVRYDRYSGNPAWTNKSKIPDTFYIQVQGTGSYPSSYMLKYTQQ